MVDTKRTDIITKIDAICKVYNILEWGLSNDYILYVDKEYLTFKEILSLNLYYHILDQHIEVIFCDFKSLEMDLWKAGPSGHRGRPGHRGPEIDLPKKVGDNDNKRYV